jgi:hypothetical protein
MDWKAMRPCLLMSTLPTTRERAGPPSTVMSEGMPLAEMNALLPNEAPARPGSNLMVKVPPTPAAYCSAARRL